MVSLSPRRQSRSERCALTSNVGMVALAAAVLALAGCSDDQSTAAEANVAESEAVSSSPTVAAPTNDSNEPETVAKTIEVAIEGSVDDPAARFFAVTYFYSPDLAPAELGETLVSVFGNGAKPPKSLEMGIAGMCGPAGYDDLISEETGFKVTPVNSGECTDEGAPYSVTLDVPPGTALGYSLEAGLTTAFADAETFDGNHLGSPNDPPTAEDFEVVTADDRTTYRYEFRS